MDPITGLAFGRLALGTVSFASPALAQRLVMLDGKANPQLPYMTRMFGSREMAIGALTLITSGKARQQVVQLGVAVDGADVVTGVLAAASGAVPTRAGLLLTAIAAGAVAVGVRELTD